jgi:hypothetical protein
MIAINLSYDSPQKMAAIPASRIFVPIILIESGTKKPLNYIFKIIDHENVTD